MRATEEHGVNGSIGSDGLSVVLSFRGRQVLVVGGGKVAVRKVRKLLGAGARIRIVSPDVDKELHQKALAGELHVEVRKYKSGDLEGVELVIAATSDGGVNTLVMEDARAMGIWCSSVDGTGKSDFYFAAEASSGGVRLGVSSEGQCPGYAQYVRDAFLGQLGPEMGVGLEVVSAIRRSLLSAGEYGSVKKHYMSIVSPVFFDVIRRGNETELDRMLVEAFGVDYTLERLGVKLSVEGDCRP